MQYHCLMPYAKRWLQEITMPTKEIINNFNAYFTLLSFTCNCIYSLYHYYYFLGKLVIRRASIRMRSGFPVFFSTLKIHFKNKNVLRGSPFSVNWFYPDEQTTKKSITVQWHFLQVYVFRLCIPQRTPKQYKIKYGKNN